MITRSFSRRLHARGTDGRRSFWRRPSERQRPIRTCDWCRRWRIRTVPQPGRSSTHASTSTPRAPTAPRRSSGRRTGTISTLVDRLLAARRQCERGRRSRRHAAGARQREHQHRDGEQAARRGRRPEPRADERADAAHDRRAHRQPRGGEGAARQGRERERRDRGCPCHRADVGAAGKTTTRSSRTLIASGADVRAARRPRASRR